MVDPLRLAVKLLGLRSILSFMLLSLRRILVVKRVWVASGDGLIELILILVRRFVGRRGEVRLRGRLIGHLEEQDEQLARDGSFEVKPRRIVQAVMFLDGARRWSGVAEKVTIVNNKTYALEVGCFIFGGELSRFHLQITTLENTENKQETTFSNVPAHSVEKG